MGDNILKDKIFISTRPVRKSEGLKYLFQKNGATLLEFPTIEIESKALTGDEKTQIQNLENFRWIIFTSANGVHHFFEHLKAINKNTIIPSHLKIAVIGDKTAKALTHFGYVPALINQGATSSDFIENLQAQIPSGNTGILIVAGTLAPDTLMNSLKEKASVSRINVYNTIMPALADSDILNIIRENCYDMIIFTSPSTIHNFMQLTASVSDKSKIRAACIGPVTAAALSAEGIEPLVVSKVMSDEGIVNAVCEYFEIG
jgi:uroporphyrinogen-III synthase